MDNLQKIIINISHPIADEALHGNFSDNTISGGIGNHVKTWIDKAQQLPITPELEQKFDRLFELLGDYDQLLPLERPPRIESASNLLSDLRANIDSVHLPKRLDFLRTPLKNVKGFGPRITGKLMSAFNIITIGDFLEYYPRDYLDRSRITSIQNVGMSGEIENIVGKVTGHSEVTPRRRGAKSIFKVAVSDGTGVVFLIRFGRNAYYLRKFLPIGAPVAVSGKFEHRYGEMQTTSFDFEPIDSDDADTVHTGRIVPVYPLVANVSQKMVQRWMRNLLDQCLEKYPEFLPAEIRKRHNLIGRRQAISEIHFPTSAESLLVAHQRLAFDEFFLLQIGLELKKHRQTTQANGIAFRGSGKLLDRFVKTLPFELTAAQKKAFAQIHSDMRSPKVMNRLLQGDVGSGKTVVAAMALVGAIESGYQGALMVPTEVLADQHMFNLSALLEPIGIKVVLLKSGLTKSERDEVINSIGDGSANVVVGTHSLIQSSVDFCKLGLVTVDEQHRFGVAQRVMLRDKGASPDVLVMTATPIPRTLALTVYGDLNLSLIDELPAGREKIQTVWIGESKRSRLYAKIREEVAKGRQVYMVYPLVSESEKLHELKAATDTSEHLQRDIFPELRIGLLHGQMSSSEKSEAMTQFKAGEVDILVSTTVIEVGIDVPNATMMVVENAERFGLAQLHQLRGRVGRGEHKSICCLVADPKNSDAIARLEAITGTSDGFELAEVDLNLRGPGEFFGTRQSGLPEFKIADLFKDAELLEVAKNEANKIVSENPNLARAHHKLLREMVELLWGEQLKIDPIG